MGDISIASPEKSNGENQRRRRSRNNRKSEVSSPPRYALNNKADAKNTRNSHIGNKTVRDARTMNNSPSKLQIFTGTGELEHEKAERTYLNPVGPGMYKLPNLTGRHAIESQKKNIPMISFGKKTKQPWHVELERGFIG